MTEKKDSIGTLLLLGVQHVFAMFGSTVLVPMLTGINVGTSLLCAGIGTWIYHLITGRKVPTFLGSSFAFIGAVTVVAQKYSGLSAEQIAALGDGLKASVEYQNGLRYAYGGIVIAGLLYAVLAIVVKFVGSDAIRGLFPPVVTGPMIIVIGLTLAPTAIDSITAPVAGHSVSTNWLIALIAIITIVLISLFAKGIFKLVPILFGIAVAYIAAVFMGYVDFTPVQQAKFISMPSISTPLFDIGAILTIAPIAVVTFVEHIGDVTANGAVVGKDFIKDPGLTRTLLGDGIATMIAGFLGGPANTTYSENTGVLAATKNYNPVTLEIAATIAILLSFLTKFNVCIQTLPGPVMGGVSVVLFGMIASVGLRTLIENQVDFKKTRNMFIVSIMLVLGLGASGAVELFGVSISGLALSAVFGLLLNKLLPENI